MTIFYLTVEGINSSVFHSQVFRYCERINTEYNIQVKLIVVQKIYARIHIKEFIKYLWIPFIGLIFTIKYIDYDKVAGRIIKKINKEYVPTQKIILHCRGPRAAFIGRIVKEKLSGKYLTVLYDVRGYSEEEAVYFENKTGEKELIRINKILFNDNYMYFNFISEELKKLYEKRYGFILEKHKYIVCNSAYDDTIYNLCENEDNKMRTPAIVYLGGNQKYQNLTNMIQIIKKLNVKGVFITKKKVFDYEDNPDMLFYSDLEPKEIKSILADCDYGIIYRDNENFNFVATPTKISEYWGMGLKVIAVNNAGAFTNAILNNEILGYVVDKGKIFDLINKLKPVSNDEKIKISEIALNNYSMKNNLIKYINFYWSINQ